MRDLVRSGAADRPGIYRMLSATGEVVYVGKSKRVRSRLLSYFRCAYPEEKGARILREAETIDWEYTPSEFAALLRELRLIKTYRPRLNYAMKRDATHYSFIKITRGAAYHCELRQTMHPSITVHSSARSESGKRSASLATRSCCATAKVT
jgi:excinuclease UvrABC nuclease subunit